MNDSIDDGCRLLAAEYLGKQLRQLGRRLRGVREGTDVEHVHQARVASRRLRAGMRMFDGCLPEKHSRRWAREIRRITRRLGSARDLDVQIEFLVGVLAGSEEKTHVRAVARLLGRLEKRRDALQPRVVAAINRFKASGVLRQMRRWKRRVVDPGQRGVVVTPSETPSPVEPSPQTRRITGQHLIEQLDDLLDHRPCLNDPSDVQGHHAMRVAAKRLRYSTEAVSPAYPETFDAFLPAVRRLQSLLGDIHDCDVWIERIDGEVRVESRRLGKRRRRAKSTSRFDASLEFLLAERIEARRRGFEQLVAGWDAWESEQLWTRFRQTLASACEEPGKEPSEGTPL